MTNHPRDPRGERFSSIESAHHQVTDRLYEERSLMAVYEQIGELIHKDSESRHQAVEPISALMRRYHR